MLTLLFRYGKLSVRRVDLVGDYAGQELFLLEGDSLLLRCFSDPDLDFDRKLQLLYSWDDLSLFKLTLDSNRRLPATSRCLRCRILPARVDTAQM